MASTAEHHVALAERRIAALRAARPDLADALDLQAELIRESLTSARPPHVTSFPLPREQLLARLSEGVPLLHEQPIELDIQFAADLFSRVVGVLQSRPAPDTDQGTRLAAIVAAATSGAIDPQRLFTEAFVQHADHLVELAAQLGVDADLLSTLARQAVAPILRAYAERLQPVIERADDRHWHRGYCAICGAWPLLGELRGVELARFSRCAGCGAGWRVQRLACPYCGNDDYRTLQTLAPEGEPRFRVSVCDRCKGYLKVANAFDPPPAELLIVDDVASMHLDVVAIEHGYHRPGGTGFPIELAVAEDELSDDPF